MTFAQTFRDVADTFERVADNDEAVRKALLGWALDAKKSVHQAIPGKRADRNVGFDGPARTADGWAVTWNVRFVARFLEKGTRPHEIRPKARVRRGQKKKRALFGPSFEHPVSAVQVRGVRERRYVRDTLERLQAAGEAELVRAINREFHR